LFTRNELVTGQTINIDYKVSKIIKDLKYRDIDTILLCEYLSGGVYLQSDGCKFTDSNQSEIISCFIFWKKNGIVKRLKIECLKVDTVEKIAKDIFQYNGVFKKKWLKQGKSMYYPPIITDQTHWKFTYYERDISYMFTLHKCQVEGESSKVWQKEVPLIKEYWKYVKFVGKGTDLVR
jgi:hypothetical protein